MQKAEMKFVTFDVQDVIAASTPIVERTFTIGGLYDKLRYNVSFVDSNGTFSYENSDGADIYKAFTSTRKLGDLNVFSTTPFKSLDNQTIEARNLFDNDGTNDGYNANSEFESRWNGIYKWVADTGYFEKIR